MKYSPDRNLLQIIKCATGAESCFFIEDIQSLWSGYGKIMRYGLKGGDRDKVVIKHVQFARVGRHPRGWTGDRAHRRKVMSYEVETAWYRDWACRCDDDCRVPRCLALESDDDGFLMVLEDLDAAGFGVRKNTVSIGEMTACLRWLANFHALFMGVKPSGLWPSGTYWHLDTRPDELAVLNDEALKNAAAAIDQKLRGCRFHTFVHGDAKLANFCFTPRGDHVAAVDFQYTGGGCGIKDVAYFIGSCLEEADCERLETLLLDDYFKALEEAIPRYTRDVDPRLVHDEWRPLYRVAWADFHRFIKGWSPGHWKIHDYSERVTRDVVAQLNREG